MPVTADDMRRVKLIAGRIRRKRSWIDKDSCESDGMAALAKAVERWEHDREIQKNYLRERYIEVAVHRAIIDGLRKRHGRTADGGFRAPAKSLDVEITNHDGKHRGGTDRTWIENLGEEDAGMGEVDTNDLLGTLTLRERAVMQMVVVDGRSIADVAREMEVSSARVRYIRNKAICKLANIHSETPSVHSVLSGREREILILISEGLSNPEIAKKLFLGTETVRTHTKVILRKMGAKNRTHAVAMAIRQRVI